MFEIFKTKDSLEILVNDKDGNFKDIRYVENFKTYSREFHPNSLFIKLRKKGFSPPMTIPFGYWTKGKKL